MSTLWIHSLVIYQLFLLATISSAQSSLYYVQCNNASLNNNTGWFSTPTLIDTSTSPITLSKIPIPIQMSKSNLTCVLRIFLSNSTYNFEEDSKCSISFDMTETNSLSPTQAPIFEPTLEPTTEPTIQPTTVPTSATPAPITTDAPTITTITPTLIPSSSPTATTDPTEYPTAIPTSHPTQYPTSIPTLEPTIESHIIDLDELVLSNIFSVNDQNIFWQTFYENGTSSVHIFPSCVNDEMSTNDNTTFATEDVFAASSDVDTLVTLLKGVALDNEYGSETFSINSSTADITPLFPISFNITTYDTIESSSFKYSQFDTNSFNCYYKDAFSMNNTAPHLPDINAIDYYLFVQDINNKTTRDHLVIDVIINTICIADTETPTNMPTNMPTTVPTINFGAFTTMYDDDDDDEDNFLGLGVSIEIFIAIIVVATIILLSSIVVGLCLCKRKSIWEDDEDEEATIMIKPPKTHKETELVTNKFMVTEDDHAEMLELAKRNSISTGLQDF